MSEPVSGDGAAGFILLEVVVALIILSLSVAAGYSAIRQGVAWLGRSDREEAALILAETALTRVGHDVPLHPGTVEGRTEDGFAWHLTMHREDGGEARASTQWVRYRVDVVVDWSDRHFRRQVNLSTVRLGLRGDDRAG